MIAGPRDEKPYMAPNSSRGVGAFTQDRTDPMVNFYHNHLPNQYSSNMNTNRQHHEDKYGKRQDALYNPSSAPSSGMLSRQSVSHGPVHQEMGQGNSMLAQKIQAADKKTEMLQLQLSQLNHKS
jgi:hypothetical protein